jgi:ribA/ribD-fused uncharacterized protein
MFASPANDEDLKKIFADVPLFIDGSVVEFFNKGESYYEFTNFANIPFTIFDHSWATSEILFQALKFIHLPDVFAKFKTFKTSREAFTYAQELRKTGCVRKDWNNISLSVMLFCLYHKFTQNPDALQLLLSTEDREIIENSPYDSFWGVGANRKGENMLGKLLMLLRFMMRNNIPYVPPMEMLMTPPQDLESQPRELST